MKSKSQTRLRIWGSGVRISSGAPFSTHLRTPSFPVLAREDRLLKEVLASLDPDLSVVHFDAVDEGMQVGLPKRHGTGAEVLTHQPAEALDQGRIDPNPRSRMRLGAFQGSSSAIAARLQGGEP